MDDSGFKDIDGFSENDLYACGGEIMHFDGQRWTKLDTPTSAKWCRTDGQYQHYGNPEQRPGQHME